MKKVFKAEKDLNKAKEIKNKLTLGGQSIGTSILMALFRINLKAQ
jgi:hypothetical protein